MSNAEDDLDAAFKYIFTWHSLSDACPKCTSLNGREWAEQSIFQETLWDMFYGNIWNLDADRTGAHPNCRCQLEVRVEVDEEKMREFMGVNNLEKII